APPRRELLFRLAERALLRVGLDRLVRGEIERRGEDAGDVVGDDAPAAREERGGLAPGDQITGAELVVHVRLESGELLDVPIEQEEFTGVDLVDEAAEGLLGDAVVDGPRAQVPLPEERPRGLREDLLAGIARQ